MVDQTILLPSKLKTVKEEGNLGVFEIDNLYPGYGHTLGNSLRRVILSSLPGAAITLIKIDGVAHEFSTIEGVQEDVVVILLNLKRVRFKLVGTEAQEVTIDIKGPKTITAKDIKTPGQVEVLNPDQHICEVTKKVDLSITMRIETGLGFVPKDVHQKNKMEVGTIALDAIFSPIRKVSYEVENMRVGDKTNHNRLRMIIETDGTLSPREALDKSIDIMSRQLDALRGAPLQTKVEVELKSTEVKSEKAEEKAEIKEDDKDMSEILKTRIDTLDLSGRTLKSLQAANIRTIGGIARKRKEDLLSIEGIGEKGIQEIRKMLSDFGLTLK